MREPVRGSRLRRGEATYWLVVFRHDIECAVCRNVLAGAVFTEDSTVESIFVIDEWEMVDPTPLLEAS